MNTLDKIYKVKSVPWPEYYTSNPDTINRKGARERIRAFQANFPRSSVAFYLGVAKMGRENGERQGAIIAIRRAAGIRRRNQHQFCGVL